MQTLQSRKPGTGQVRDSHRDDYIRVTQRMRKMDTTHDGGEGSESVGDAFKLPQIVGKDFEGSKFNTLSDSAQRVSAIIT